MNSIFSPTSDVKRDLEELQVKHRDLLKTISYYAAKEACVCPRGWKIHQGSCYYFSTEKMNWAQSQQYCISREAHLVIVKDLQEQNFLWSNAGEGHWIGLNDQETEGQWVWVDNTPLDKSATQFWWPNEPDNWTGGGDRSGEDCGSLGNRNKNFCSAGVLLWSDGNGRALCRSTLELLRTADTARKNTLLTPSSLQSELCANRQRPCHVHLRDNEVCWGWSLIYIKIRPPAAGNIKINK
ncbi:hypothetical protein SKAU_G00405370 [Synaphobranchus kaupii]|uniref:C-type lectin domain-containing protein n=1 Tax=Synaphobranchus kaupii TaxID=118154 RepID=A0A9Q1E9X7_SYNKA|nr:hypothetical protein SKAU_G00405370 [Synaphobranchus kaupii]